ncbi:MAG: CheR family methyltransferase [candidate division KSB1 bacterium]|nr:CheR family methyltransferase [candidate division KSB1 bacterium]
MLPRSNILLPVLKPLIDLIEQRIGMSFNEDEYADLYKIMNRMSESQGYRSVGSYINDLLQNRINYGQLNLLVYELTNGESYFFRESEYLHAVFKWTGPMIQKAAPSGKKIRIWSAGCSCGQEPYSIAILLDRYYPAFYQANLTLLGTDINHEFLVTARQGLYKSWSFRNSLSWLMGHYFLQQKNGSYRLKESIRSKVKFKQLNLLDDSYPDVQQDTGEVHFLFCRNVLSYMTPQAISVILEKFWKSLKPNGWLVVGRCETGLVHHSGFKAVSFDGVTLFQKQRQKKIQAPEYNIVTVKHKHGTPDDVLKEHLISIPEKFYQLGQFEKAYSLLNQENGNLSAGDCLLMSKCAQGMNRINEAMQWCDEAVQHDWFNPSCHYQRAIIQQERGDSDAAILSFQRAIAQDSQYLPAYMGLSFIYKTRNKNELVVKLIHVVRKMLNQLDDQTVIPEMDGMTVKRLKEFVNSV